MPEHESSSDIPTPMDSLADTRVPIIAEEVSVSKREVDLERVDVRTTVEEHQVVVREPVRRERMEVTCVPMDREVAEAPPIRTEGDVTVVSIVEERLVVEKRLFLVEELHLIRTSAIEQVEVPVTLRRMRADVEREHRNEQENG